MADNLPAALRPVLEALQRIGGFMSLSPRDYWDELGQSCRAALALSADSPCNEHNAEIDAAAARAADSLMIAKELWAKILNECYGSSSRKTPADSHPQDVSRPEQTPPSAEEIEAFDRRAAAVGTAQALRELESDNALPPDAELDRLLTDFGALMWDRGRGRAIVPNDIPQRKAIHAYVEKVTREARTHYEPSEAALAAASAKFARPDPWPHICNHRALHQAVIAAYAVDFPALSTAPAPSAAPPTNAPEISTALVDAAAPDAELDRLLWRLNALEQDIGIADERGDTEAKAEHVDTAVGCMAAIHAHVERMKREAQGAEFIAGAEDAERRIAMLLADDGCAASHQTIGQYRASLLRVLRSNTATTSTAPDSSPAARPAPARSNHPEQSI